MTPPELTDMVLNGPSAVADVCPYRSYKRQAGLAVSKICVA